MERLIVLQELQRSVLGSFDKMTKSLKTFQDFNSFINSATPLSIVYFTAAWCGPCRAIKPYVEKLAAESTNLAIGKVDVDKNSVA